MAAAVPVRAPPLLWRRMTSERPHSSSWQALKTNREEKKLPLAFIITVSTPFQSNVVYYEIITDVIKTFFQ